MLEAFHALKAEGAENFFAARLEDELGLRADFGTGPPIGALDGFSPTKVGEAAADDITPVANSLELLETISTAAHRLNTILRAFAHLDTAMNRLGLSPDDNNRAGPLPK